jgi:stage V sporulation protein B
MNGDNDKIAALKLGSSRLFALIGLIGMLIMVALSRVYSVYIASSPKSIYTILVLSFSILFSCMAASYRGYYEGFMNMVPTSVSQLLEAVFKLVFGLIFAKIAMAYLYNSYLETGVILGQNVVNDEQALSVIYPFSSAAAMLGVTLGSYVSFIYVWIYYLINKPNLPKPSNFAVHDSQKELFSFAFPIMISCAVQSVFQFLDTATVQYALSNVGSNVLKEIYSDEIAIAKVTNSDLVTYVYGLLSTALDFKNLIPGITMALGVSAVPAISSACEMKDSEHLSALINSIYKSTVLLSLYGGLVLALCNEDILTLFYGSASPDIVTGCNDLVKYFGFTAVFYSAASTAVFAVQAVGCPQKSIKPYIVSGIIRVVLNLLLVSDKKYVLFGAVISGAVGYFVMWVWNIKIVTKVTKTKFDIKNVAIKPLFVAAVSYCLSDKMFLHISLTVNIIYKLLIEIVIFSLLFCILCFLCKVLKFSGNFFTNNYKKNRLNA